MAQQNINTLELTILNFYASMFNIMITIFIIYMIPLVCLFIGDFFYYIFQENINTVLDNFNNKTFKEYNERTLLSFEFSVILIFIFMILKLIYNLFKLCNPCR